MTHRELAEQMFAKAEELPSALEGQLPILLAAVAHALLGVAQEVDFVERAIGSR